VPDRRRVRFAAMGTEVVLVLERRAPIEAEAAVQNLFAAWEETLSRFRPGSALARLNRSAGRPVRVAPLLLRVLEAALAAARATGGAFDPTLGRQIAAAGYDRAFGPTLSGGPGRPGPGRPGGAWREVALDRERGTVTLPSGAALDLGGIAKGMAVDASLALLRRAGVGSALVSAGGDLAVSGPPPPGGWSIALPESPGHERVTLHGGALATTSVARRHWLQGGRPRHHLLDPRTGEPARSDLWAVTVAAATCEQAEVAATAAFVLGARAGEEFLRARRLPALLTPVAGVPRPVGPWPARAA
jgi:thiamine biosynthesis lipoprotein